MATLSTQDVSAACAAPGVRRLATAPASQLAGVCYPGHDASRQTGALKSPTAVHASKLASWSGGQPPHSGRFARLCIALLLALTSFVHAEDTAGPWWDKKWPTRRQITIDTSDKGIAIKDNIGSPAVLLRFSDNTFSFLASTEDGRDLRFIADDHKTLLKHHVEKWDGLLNEAYVWVRVPDLKPGATTTVWLYYGNQTDATKQEDANATYDSDIASGIYHFGDNASLIKDSSAAGAALEGTPTLVASALAGGGLRLLGQAPVSIAAAPLNEWATGSSLTWSVWFKATALQPNATLFARRDGAGSFVVSLDNGIPYLTINGQKSSAGAAVTAGTWNHFAVIVDGAATKVYLNGSEFGALAAGLPALKTAMQLGKDTTGSGFVGELDELQMEKTARPVGFIKFLATSQAATSDAQKLVAIGQDEAGHVEHESVVMEHVNLIKDISKDLTIDGWVVIGACTLLAIVGGIVAFGKLLYLNKIAKASEVFLQKWEKLSADMTALDHEAAESGKTLAMSASGKSAKLMKQSPLYHIYHLGSEEIQKRLDAAGDRFNGLSGRSIQAIKAALHGGLVREVQKLNSKLVFLTIGIAGGPYLGLLGTVIGVMITFAVIAKSGQVEVNSIAPGIAGALLATVAGLAVAIPALFAYSYLASRIKDAVTDMETFIDEFIAKMAELYKEGKGTATTPKEASDH